MKPNSHQNSLTCLRALMAAAVFCLWTALPASAQSDGADDTGHKFELAKQYYGDCQDADDERFGQIRPYLKAFTDMEVMADTLADPARFARLMSVVNDPRTIHVMTKCATEPVMWETWMNGMTDFNKMTRVMMRFMNPNMYMSWMMAPMNPAMYQPMMQFMDPAYYTRWMTAMMNPVFYQPVTLAGGPRLVHPADQLADESPIHAADVQHDELRHAGAGRRPGAGWTRGERRTGGIRVARGRIRAGPIAPADYFLP